MVVKDNKNMDTSKIIQALKDRMPESIKENSVQYGMERETDELTIQFQAHLTPDEVIAIATVAKEFDLFLSFGSILDSNGMPVDIEFVIYLFERY